MAYGNYHDQDDFVAYGDYHDYDDFDKICNLIPLTYPDSFPQ